ncbi:MAG: hypothetical protein HY322_19535 [Betaproteobacteria bacterium]|nr:hypothetical protein [Betaproteobacteria bacterium]
MLRKRASDGKNGLVCNKPADTPHFAARGVAVRAMAYRAGKAWQCLTRAASRNFGYALVAILFSVLVMLAVQAYAEVKRELTEVAMSRRGSVAQLAAATLSERLDRMLDLAVSLGTRVRFAELVSEGRWEAAARILRSVPSEFRFVDRVVIYDVRGTVMADVPELAGAKGENRADRDWYKGVSRGWKPYVSEVYRRGATPQRIVFAVVVPILDRAGAPAGVLQLQVHLEKFFDWVKAISQDSASAAYVVDSKGTAAFHSLVPVKQQLIDLSGTPAVARLLRNKSGVEIVADATRSEQVYAFMPSRHGWGVVVQDPAVEVFAARDNALRRLLVAYAVIFAFCAAVVGLTIQLVTQHRRALVDKHLLAELERRVVARTSELEASNKELEGFSYSVSHDLRAPLRAVAGYAQMLLEDHLDQLDPEAQRKLDVIQDEARRMGELIDDLLAFSRLGRKAMQVGDVDMTGLARATYDGLNGRNHGVKPEFRLATLPRGKGDRVLLGQVWANLISNALKFTSKRERPLIEVSAISDEKEHVYFVRDNGAGFDPRYQSKLFGVFQRLHKSTEFPGTGVGLALVQRIVVRHGGRVWADSRLDEGATFYFTLPKEQADERF